MDAGNDITATMIIAMSVADVGVPVVPRRFVSEAINEDDTADKNAAAMPNGDEEAGRGPTTRSTPTMPTETANHSVREGAPYPIWLERRHSRIVFR